MAIKVFCNICEKFIKNAEQPEFQKLTGKEMCTDCGEKVKGLYQVLDERIKDYNADLEKKLAFTKKKFATLDAAHAKFHADAQSLYTTTKAELDSQIQNILVGDE